MNKKLFFKAGVALVFVAVAVVWLLSVLMPEKFGHMNFAWLIAIASGLLGILFILRGLFSKTVTIGKKFYIAIGAVFLIAAVLALVGTFIDTKLVLPVIAVIITVAGLLGILAVGGKKWDSGDNENVGYKNYYQRKKEEEERAKKENRNDD